MDLLAPGFLGLLLGVPLLVAAYLWVLRRRRVTIRYSSLSLIRAAQPRSSAWRRHVPFGLFVLALVSLIIGISRPITFVRVPSGQATIMLALDVSRSMQQTDIAPSRIDAAKAAALNFIRAQETGTQIGIVAFAGYAEIIQLPTADQDVLADAVRNLRTQRGTAIGSGILTALDAISEIDPNVAPRATDPSQEEPSVAPGNFVPHIVVVLTDGVSTTGPLPLDAAQFAVNRGVRVYTIGFGTENGSPGFGGPWAGGGFGQGDPLAGGGRFRRGIDERTLKEIATLTEGKYYAANSAGELQDVLASLPTYVITRQEIMEVSVVCAAIGAVLVAAAMGLALLWQPLP